MEPVRFSCLRLRFSLASPQTHRTIVQKERVKALSAQASTNATHPNTLLFGIRLSKVPPLVLRHHPYRARRPGTKAHHFLSKCHGGARPSSERSRKPADMCGRPLMELIREDGHLPLHFPLETLPTSGPVKAQGSLAQIQLGAGGRGRIGGEGLLELDPAWTPHLLNLPP